MKIRTLIAVLALAAGGATMAQTATPQGAVATPKIDQREANQEKRIDQGVASGQLTDREAKRLELRQQHIARAEQRAKADGTVTAQERKRLGKMEDHASKDIRREKHDGQRDMNQDGQRDHQQGRSKGGNKS